MPTRLDRSRSGRLPLGSAPRRWRGRRWRTLRWVAAIGLSLVAAASVAALVARAQQTLDAYGTRRRVAVARHELEAGHRIRPDDIDWRDLPVGAIPRDALHDSPVGHTTVDRVGAGEVLGRLRIAPDGLSGLAALVPAGRRAVAVPTSTGALALVPGDRVDVLATDRSAPGLGERTEPGEVVAADALVLARAPASVTVAVTPAEARALADALGRGTPLLDLQGAG